MEIPILFNTEMVRAILDGHKTMTRRIVKLQPPKGAWPIFDALDCYQGEGWAFQYPKEIAPGIIYNSIFKLPNNGKCPYGQAKDTLWIREAWAQLDMDYKVVHGKLDSHEWQGCPIVYRADYPDKNIKWRPSIFMPRRACRITPKVVSIRIEYLQEITEEDAIAEGCEAGHELFGDGKFNDVIEREWTAKEAFIELWNLLNAKPNPVYKNGRIISYVSYPWEDVQEIREYRGKQWLVIGNPCVWVIEYNLKNRSHLAGKEGMCPHCDKYMKYENGENGSTTEYYFECECGRSYNSEGEDITDYDCTDIIR